MDTVETPAYWVFVCTGVICPWGEYSLRVKTENLLCHCLSSRGFVYLEMMSTNGEIFFLVKLGGPWIDRLDRKRTVELVQHVSTYVVLEAQGR